MEDVMDRSSTLLISTICRYNLVVECHASDLVARVRFPLPAPRFYKKGYLTNKKLKRLFIDQIIVICYKKHGGIL